MKLLNMEKIKLLNFIKSIVLMLNETKIKAPFLAIQSKIKKKQKMNIDFSGWVREHFILIDCSYKYMGGQESFPTNKSSDSMVIDKSQD